MWVLSDESPWVAVRFWLFAAVLFVPTLGFAWQGAQREPFLYLNDYDYYTQVVFSSVEGTLWLVWLCLGISWSYARRMSVFHLVPALPVVAYSLLLCAGGISQVLMDFRGCACTVCPEEALKSHLRHQSSEDASN